MDNNHHLGSQLCSVNQIDHKHFNIAHQESDIEDSICLRVRFDEGTSKVFGHLILNHFEKSDEVLKTNLSEITFMVSFKNSHFFNTELDFYTK